MNSTRRDFLAKTGLAGAGLMAANFLRGATPAKASTANTGRGARAQHFNMCGYAAPKLEKVRLGLVGVGSRGTSAITRLKAIEGLEIKALCDIDPGQISAALKKLEGTTHKP